MEECLEKRIKQIELLSTVLNKNKIQEMVNKFEKASFDIYKDEIKIKYLPIGYIRPKDEDCNLDFYKGNIGIVTVDIEIDKDLNGEKLVFHVNNEVFEVFDMDTLDILEYAQNFIDEMDKDFIYKMLERYDCRPSELAQEYVDDLGVEYVIGDTYLDDTIEDKEYGIRSNAYMDLKRIEEELEERKQNKEVVLFGNYRQIINDLEQYRNALGTKILTDDDIYNIGVLVNKLVNSKKFENKSVLEYILDECNLLD